MEITDNCYLLNFCNKYHRVIAFLMCLVFIFTAFVCMKTQAEAVEPVTVTLAILEKLLILFGIVVTSYVLIQAFQNYLQDTQTEDSTGIMDWVDELSNRPDSNGNSPKNGGDISINAFDVAAMTHLYQQAKKFFKDKQGEIEVIDTTRYDLLYGEIPITNITSTTSSADLYVLAPYVIGDEVYVTDLNGVIHKFYVTQGDYGIWWHLDNWIFASSGLTTATSIKYGFMLLVYGDVTYLSLYAAFKYLDNGIERTASIVQTAPYYNDPGRNAIPISSGDVIEEHPSEKYAYTNDPIYSPSTVIDAINDKTLKDGVVQIPQLDPTADPSTDSQKDTLIDIGIDIDPRTEPTPMPSQYPEADPDLPYKPDVTALPDIGSLWDYVSDFMSNALIWMLLWFNGFLMLPIEIQYMLWALLVITIVIGLLGVFLK
ncbi:MAG: hypothetical protein VB064_15230 [Oscillospiraceae bacterium]|nr:hypothetical protein [Oscillospiraceae bacterium]